MQAQLFTRIAHINGEVLSGDGKKLSAGASLQALLRAYELTSEPWCQTWYWRIHDYAFARLPNREYGDWYQNLNRQGELVPIVVNNLQVKDPFHSPRSLIYSILSLRNLASPEGAGSLGGKAEIREPEAWR